MDGIINMIENIIPMQSFIDGAYDFINNLGIIEQAIGINPTDSDLRGTKIYIQTQI